MEIKVLYGAPCSGKSTRSKELMTEQSILWDHDCLLRAMTTRTDHRTEEHVGTSLIRSLRRDFLWQLNSTYHADALQNCDQVIILSDWPSDRLREQLAAFDPEYIKMEATLQECLERLAGDDMRPDKSAWEEIIRGWFARHEPEPAEERTTKMTPNNKTKFKETAQVRALAAFDFSAAQKRLNSDHYVEGYAARYEPYVLYYVDGEPVYERFERGCFDGCDMSDVVYLLNHEGRVFARSSNGTLIVAADDNGLFFAADLSRTVAARDHYDDDIKTGMITKMSWRFAVGEYYYDTDTRTIVHTKVRKVYDVAPVNIPANDDTEINARALVDEEIDLAELDIRRRRLRAKIRIALGGKINGQN